tara:strand:+ start:181 stop:2376 length:2196 start_codon:yes stop_codon:yes gene_type:complete
MNYLTISPYNELANISKAEYLIKNWSKIDIKWGKSENRKDSLSQKKILKTYIKKIKECENTVYEQPNLNGRMYANGVSLQNIKKEIRNYICSEYYNDYDLKNAQINGLNEMCKKIGLKVDYINDYCINRKNHLKQEVIEVLFSDNFVRPLNNEEDYLYLMNLNKDFEKVKDNFMNNINYQDKIKQLKKTKKGINVRGRLMSNILQEYENKILTKAIEFVKKDYTINNEVFMFDGFMHPKNEHINVDKLNEYILTELNEFVEIIVKPFGTPLTFIEPDVEGATIIKNFECESSKLFLIELNGRLKLCQGNYYFKEDTGLWTSNKSIIINALIKLALNLNYITESGAYSCVLSNAKNIVQATMAILSESPTFLTELFESSLGKICWDDGWYDFEKKEFTEGFDDIMTTIKIPRKFPVRDETDIMELKKRIIDPIFGHLSQSSLASFSRSLAGCMDKTWRVIIGERNSGKSKWIDLLKTAFGNYSVVIAGDNFIFERAGNGADKAKKMSWAIPLEFARFANTSEIKIDETIRQKIDGVLIKSISGCDEIQVRNNYTNERTMKIQAGTSLMANDIGNATPTDVYETMFPINLPNKFVDADELKSEYPFMKLKDETIDNLVKETRIGDALFWVLVDNYSTVKPKMTPDMKEFRDQFLEKDDFKIINDIFTITKDKDNFVENKDMEAFIRNKQLNMTLIKLQNYLIKRGAKRDIVLINKVSKRGLTNLIKLEIPDDD